MNSTPYTKTAAFNRQSVSHVEHEDCAQQATSPAGSCVSGGIHRTEPGAQLCEPRRGHPARPRPLELRAPLVLALEAELVFGGELGEVGGPGLAGGVVGHGLQKVDMSEVVEFLSESLPGTGR